MQRKRPTLALTRLSSAVYRHIVRSKVISKTRYAHQLTAKRTLWLEHARPSRTTCATTYTLPRAVLFPGPMAIARFGFAAPPHKQPSLSLNRIPFPSLWALTTVPASGSLPILWLSPCPWPWPTPFFLWYAHSSLFPEGAHALCSILFSLPFQRLFSSLPCEALALDNLTFGLSRSMGDGRWAMYIQRSPWAVARIFPMSTHTHSVSSVSVVVPATPSSSFLPFCRACALSESACCLSSFFYPLRLCVRLPVPNTNTNTAPELLPLPAYSSCSRPCTAPLCLLSSSSLLFSSLPGGHPPCLVPAGYIALSLLIPVPVPNNLSTRMHSILFPFPYRATLFLWAAGILAYSHKFIAIAYFVVVVPPSNLTDSKVRSDVWPGATPTPPFRSSVFCLLSFVFRTLWTWA
ncbi:hypothetical protein B0H13DRAFT_2318173 [Mycena leptocephala]|nr:hypothetical protein B0H13DRAFT_2318173 [Mycena leptocephala]